MIKINEVYQHEETGIVFDVEYVTKACHLPGAFVTIGHVCVVPGAGVKRVRITPSQQSGWVRGEKGFIFSRSKPEMIKKIGQALLEIGEFTEKL